MHKKLNIHISLQLNNQLKINYMRRLLKLLHNVHKGTMNLKFKNKRKRIKLIKFYLGNRYSIF